MVKIIDYMQTSNVMAPDTFMANVLVNAFNLKTGTILNAVELDTLLRKFFALTEFDTVSARRKRFGQDPVYPVTLNVDKNIFIGAPSDIMAIYDYFPKTRYIYPYFVQLLKGNIDVLNQNIITLNLLDDNRNPSKFVDFLFANKAYNTHSDSLYADLFNYSSVNQISTFLDTVEFGYDDVLKADDYFSLLFSSLGVNIAMSITRTEFNDMMGKIYEHFGFGSWKLNLNITRDKGVFIITQNTYSAFRKNFLTLSQVADLIRTVSDYYRLPIYSDINLSTVMVVKLYKDSYGIDVFSN